MAAVRRAGTWRSWAAVALVLAALPCGAGAKQEPDTARVVRDTQALEADPLRADAVALREWLLKWATETPDYRMNVCNLLGVRAVGPEASPLADALILQLLFGNAAHQVAHGQEGGELAQQVAAVESALRAYEAYQRADPTLRIGSMEALQAQRKAGTLRAHLAPRVADECTNGDSAPLAKAESRPDAPMTFLGGFLRESHVVYPLVIDGWEMNNEHRYDTEDAGASVRFLRGEDRTGWIDVYFYPVGSLDAAKARALADGERESLVDAWQEKNPKPLQLSALGELAVQTGTADAPATLKAYAADFRYANEDKEYNSVLVVAVDRLYAVKIRYSALASSIKRPKLRAEAEAFMRALLLRLDIRSTGGCWMPSPVELLVPGVAPPRETLAVIQADDVPVAWILEDRVVTRDADLVGTPAIQLQAMAVQGRAFPGCVGRNPIQPEVKEGMREIRFEYAERKPSRQ